MASQLSLIPDDTPQGPSKRPAEPIIRTAVIEGEYRFLLKRAWGSGPCILWCGTNPSTADASRDDPTMWREIEFSYRWGFGSLVKINVYPFRTPSMSALMGWRNRYIGKPDNWSVGASNAFAAWRRNLLTAREAMNMATKYVAAWGNGVDADDLEHFLRHARPTVDTSEHDGFGDQPVPVDWQCLGTNQDGSPKHTLARGLHRIPDDAQPILWRKAA